MHGWMNGMEWMDGWMDGWIDRWIDRWMDEEGPTKRESQKNMVE
jgi:hypothetical protein